MTDFYEIWYQSYAIRAHFSALTHLCLTFHYWNGCDVGVICTLLFKVIAGSDFFHI